MVKKLITKIFLSFICLTTLYIISVNIAEKEVRKIENLNTR